MEEKSFIPLTDIDKNETRSKKQHSLEKQVFKKGSIKKGQSRIIRHDDQNHENGMQCTPVKENGIVTAIDIQCECGSTQRITLEYGETA